MCSLFKKRGWLKNFSQERSNQNFTRDSLFGNDISIDEMIDEPAAAAAAAPDDDDELGAGLRHQKLKQKKYTKAKPKRAPKKPPKKKKPKKKTPKKTKKVGGECCKTIAKKKKQKFPKKKFADIFSQYL